MRTLDQIESEVRFLGATLLTPDEDFPSNVCVMRKWSERKGFVVEDVQVAAKVELRTLIRMPDYKVPRGPA